MKLRFYARDDDLVYVPTSVRAQGQPPQYVGRDFVPGDLATKTPGRFPASDRPFECDSESDDGRELVNRFLRGKRPLWPADEETAQACGVQFVRVAVRDGVAAPVPIQPAVSRSTKAERASAGSEGE